MEWSPQWAPHAVGTFEPPRPNGDGGWEPIVVTLLCRRCGQTFQVTCEQAMPRRHVQKWALVHLHRNPLKVDPAKDPAFGRRIASPR